MAKLRMIVDGWSSSNVGFGVFTADTRRNLPARTWVTERVAQRAEHVLLASDPEYADRALVVRGHLAGDNSTDFVAKRNELAARMDRKDEVEISFSDSTDQTYFARLEAFTHEHLTKRSLADDDVEIQFRLVRPWRYDKTTSVTTGVSTGAVAIPLGTAPTRDVTLLVRGPTTNVWNIHYESSTGGAVHTVGFSTLALASTAETVTLDMQKGTITGTTGNNLTAKRVSDSTGGQFPFALDPRDGEFWNSNWPTLRTESGTLKATVRKAYL